MSVETVETTWLDGINVDGSGFCHLYEEGYARTLCGIPASEAPPHGVDVLPTLMDSHCQVCGKPACQRCEIVFASDY